MKKHLLTIGAVALLLLNACNKEQVMPDATQNKLKFTGETVKDSTGIIDDWNKHKFPGEE